MRVRSRPNPAFILLSLFFKLNCAENSVAGVAQTRADVGVFVELAVEVSDVKLNVGVSLHQCLYTLGSGDD